LALRQALPGWRQGTAGDVLADLCIRKTDREVDALRRAAAAIDAVHLRMGEWLRPGRRESTVAADIAAGICEAGHVTADFTIVASGPNSASPHHDSSERVIEPGDVVLVDIGGTMPDGYRSDSTRTYVVGGEPSSEFLDAYNVLRSSQQVAVGTVRPNISAASVDAAARQVLADHGYGEFFLHRTGHGIGLDGHEEPYIVSGNERRLEPGMVFSIEPGFYLSGRYGARIEDIVVCTGSGVERLNTISTEIVVL
jgi:Xaa-Pro aminopeptidase